jgi:serine/threonine protein kinase
MSDVEDTRPDEPDPSRILDICKELGDLDESEREKRLNDLDPETAGEVRRRLEVEKTLEIDPSGYTVKDPSEAETIAPGFKGDPPQFNDREQSPNTLPDNHRQLVGRSLGPYSIRRLIGSGGMGQVWEAIQENPQRSVALKILRATIISPAARERFKFEVEILGRLRHPNIAQIYDAGEMDLDGEIIPYFAMEYIGSAQPIDEYCRRKNLSLVERLEIFTKVCEAVSHGHQRGIIHRDLKPANILIDRDGRPKVIDYGVARVTDSDTRATIARTNVGQLIGTLQYMSPEQCGGDPEDIDIRADVYSLGVILFELMAEQPPYDLRRAAIAEAVQIIQNKLPPRLSSFDREIAYDVEVIAGKALEKEPVRRYRSAGDLADDVRRFLDDEPINARPPSMSEIIKRYARKNRAMATAMLGITVAIALGVAGIIVFAVQAENQRILAVDANEKLEDSLLKEQSSRKLSEERFMQIRSLANELLGPIAKQVQNLQGSSSARMMIIESGRRYLEELQEKGRRDADLNYEIAIGFEHLGDLMGGRQTGSLGELEKAMTEFKKAESIYREQTSEEESIKRKGDLSRVLQKQGEILMYTDIDAATERFDESRSLAIQVHEALEGDSQSTIRLTSILMKTGDLLSNAGESGRAMVYYDETRKLMSDHLEIDPGNLKLQRNLALIERRIAWLLEEREAIAEAGELWKSSLDRIRSISASVPEDNRRRWDVAWSCYHYGSFMMMHTEEEDGPELMAESLSTMTDVCVSSPTDTQYRTDLAQLAPVVYEEIVQSGRKAMADRLIRKCLLALQEAVESNPENVGLDETYTMIVKLRNPDNEP